MPCLTGEIPSAFIVDPVFVQLRVPERGFGTELDAMAQFFRERGEELRSGCFQSKPQGGAYILFCFRDPKNAAEFARRFDGEILVPSDDDLLFP
jgi:hypothetical protein